MAFQMVRNFFEQRSPSRSRVHEPVIESESFGNQGGIAIFYTVHRVSKTVPTYFLFLVCQVWTDFNKNFKDCPGINA